MTRSSLLGRGVIAVWLTIMWLLLWGDVNLANVLSGVVLVGVCGLRPSTRVYMLQLLALSLTK